MLRFRDQCPSTLSQLTVVRADPFGSEVLVQRLEKPLHPHIKRLLRDAHVPRDVRYAEPLVEVETDDQRVFRRQPAHGTTERRFGRLQASLAFVVEHPIIR